MSGKETASCAAYWFGMWRPSRRDAYAVVAWASLAGIVARGRKRSADSLVEQADDAQAVAWLTQAGDLARELYAYDSAAALYRRALRAHTLHQRGDLPGRFALLMAREAVLERLGNQTEWARVLTELVSVADALGAPDAIGQAAMRQADQAMQAGAYEQAQGHGARALSVYREAGDRPGEARALRELGYLHWSSGNYGQALAHGREALSLHRLLGDTEGEATAQHNLAEIHRNLASPDQALRHYENALELLWALGARRRQALSLYGMAHTYRQMGDAERARERYRQALDLWQAAGDRLMASRAEHAMAGLCWSDGEPEAAGEHMERALAISREIGFGAGIAHGLAILGAMRAQLGAEDQARRYLAEAITWLDLAEDGERSDMVKAQLDRLERDEPVSLDLYELGGWVKNHISMAEGKVYCEFESLLARQRSPGR